METTQDGIGSQGHQTQPHLKGLIINVHKLITFEFDTVLSFTVFTILRQMLKC